SVSTLFPYTTLFRSHLMRIRVAFFDHTHGQAVSAENELRARTVRKLPQSGRDFLDQSLDVMRMIVEILNQMLRRAVARLSKDATDRKSTRLNSSHEW